MPDGYRQCGGSCKGRSVGNCSAWRVSRRPGAGQSMRSARNHYGLACSTFLPALLREMTSFIGTCRDSSRALEMSSSTSFSSYNSFMDESEFWLSSNCRSDDPAMYVHI